MIIFLNVKGKPNERRGRKTTGLRCDYDSWVTKGEIHDITAIKVHFISCYLRIID